MQALLALDLLVENQLNLQVKISYPVHHDFMTRHKLNECARVLDVGTGNGLFASRLALDHPSIQIVGIDKRKPCIDQCQKLMDRNFEVAQVDVFSRTSDFDYSSFDGFLLRYFLLHVDHSQKILELFQAKAKRPARFWIIDLDYTQFSCDPRHPVFDQLINLVKEFCIKKSIDSLAGQRVVPMLKALGYQNIKVENIPFSNQTVPIADLVLYLKQEVQLYSRMMGRAVHDPEITGIVRFIDEEVLLGKFQISYGMVLIFAELS